MNIHYCCKSIYYVLECQGELMIRHSNPVLSLLVIHGPKPVGPRTFREIQDRTRTKYTEMRTEADWNQILSKIFRSLTGPNHDQKFEILGSDRTDRFPTLEVRGFLTVDQLTC